MFALAGGVSSRLRASARLQIEAEVFVLKALAWVGQAWNGEGGCGGWLAVWCAK